ncbi:hypothetical protein [Nonomuraea sp. NPDC048826]|uniref:hypothetical protein n=1 Tax=Nonomuraea sp. NPDC048826 TaxID=3364347 RepID=UPI0037141534
MVGGVALILIPCPLAMVAYDFGKLLITPAVLCLIVFVLAVMFGPGRGGQISSTIDVIAWIFGERVRALTFAAVLLLGLLGFGLMSGADYLAAGCIS